MCGYEWDVSEEASEEPCPHFAEGHVCVLADDGHWEHECACGATQVEERMDDYEDA